jgi:dienelactone hydrolase
MDPSGPGAGSRPASFPRTGTTLAALLLCALAGGGHAQSAARATPPPGAYAVGFRTMEVTDPARSYGAPYDADGNPTTVRPERPIAVSVWYPARAGGGGEPMVLAHYLASITAPGRPPVPPRERHEAALRLLQRPMTQRVAREVAAPVLATADAPAAAGRFPLVVYASGAGGSAVEGFHLHEWLASRGYVVVGSDSRGPAGPMTLDAEGLEAQARDLEFLLGWARARPDVDGARVALVGFSWGGMANLVAAMRNRSVGAVVSLDGSMHLLDGLSGGLPSFGADRLTVPALFLRAGQVAADPAATRAPDLFERLRYSDATRLTLHGLGHLNFSSLSPLVAEAGPDLVTDTLVVAAALERIARYTTAFLDAVLRDDPEGLAFLSRPPVENGIPPAEATLERRAAHRPLPTAGAFAAEVRARGRALAAAPAVLREVRARNDAYTLPEAEVNAWGYALLGRNRADDAIGVFTLNTVVHPESANAHDSLGDGLLAAGRLEEARSHYARAVRIAAASGDPRLATFRANLERTEQRLRRRP